MEPDVEDFLAHVGVKGMKWGVRRKDAQLTKAFGSTSGGAVSVDAEPKGMSRKKKAAIGAGVVIGGAALIALGTVAANKQLDANRLKTLADVRKKAETRLAGEKAAKAQINAFASKSKWELMATLPNPPKNEPAKGNKGQQKTKAAVDAFVGKSKYQLMTELPSKSKGSYSKSDIKKDTKLYGEKGAARIQKNVNKGMLLSKARQNEAVRQNGAKALKIAMGIKSAGAKEAAEYKTLKKLAGKS